MGYRQVLQVHQLRELVVELELVVPVELVDLVEQVVAEMEIVVVLGKQEQPTLVVEVEVVLMELAVLAVLV
tara:strand:+ start:345 stop:557 length:213 start_codon:yes stop_codon:yes gene_type:complete